MKTLMDVDELGAVDADADNLLEQCFEDHEAYLNAKSHKKFLIIGRKGSGKLPSIENSCAKRAILDSHSVMILPTIHGTFTIIKPWLEFQMSKNFSKVGDI
jgi:hypothetical protein